MRAEQSNSIQNLQRSIQVLTAEVLLCPDQTTRRDAAALRAMACRYSLEDRLDQCIRVENHHGIQIDGEASNLVLFPMVQR